MKSKTIILSADNKTSRGIFTIYTEDDMFKIRMRLYNMPKLEPHHKLGIYQEQVYSANMIEKTGTYLSSIVGDFDISKDFYVAIIDTENDNTPVLTGGTYAGMYFCQDDKFKDIEKDDYSPTISANSLCHSEPIPYPSEQSEESNHVFTNKVSCNSEESRNISTLLKSITEQFDYIFDTYPEDADLNTLVPNSKFVEIQENQNKYSIGVIYKDDTIAYICYAVFCLYNQPVPSEIGDNYQWLPTDPLDPLSDGYYMVFQDSTDLKIVKI